MASGQNYNTASEQSPDLASDKQTLSLGALTAFVVGSMVGAGMLYHLFRVWSRQRSGRTGHCRRNA